MTDLYVPVLRCQGIRAWPHHADGGVAQTVPLASALSEAFGTDAHYTGYAPGPIERRLDKGLLSDPDALAKIGGAVRMQLAIFDVDCSESHKALGGDGAVPAPDDWWLDEQPKVAILLEAHPGLFVYRTRGGYRVLGRLPEPIAIRTSEDAAAWTSGYLAWVAYLRRRFQIIADPGCKEWQRLFRLPRATRDEGGRPEHRETIGDPGNVGAWHCEPTSEDVAAAVLLGKKPERQKERKPRPENTPAYVGRGVLHKAFEARGWLGHEIESGKWAIRCPRYDEHSKKNGAPHDPFDTSTILWEPDAGEELGYLHCSHANCGHDRFNLKDWISTVDQSELDQARDALGIPRRLPQPRQTWDPSEYADLGDRAEPRVGLSEELGSVPENDTEPDDSTQTPRVVAPARVSAIQRYGLLSKRDLFKRVYERMSKPETGRGCPTGISELDESIGGYRRGNVTILGGKRSAGKTLFLMLAHDEAAQAGKGSLVIGCEDSAMLYATRWMAKAADISALTLRDLEWKDSHEKARDFQKAATALSEACALPFFMPAIGMTVEQIAQAIKELAKEIDLELISADYLQVIRSARSFGDKRALEVSYVASTLSHAIKDVNAAGILGSQLKRSDRERPTLEDLKETGDLENEAEHVLLIYRKKGDAGEPDQRFLNVGKNKDGEDELEDIPLVFIQKTASFRSTYGLDGIARPGELDRAWSDAEDAAEEDMRYP